MISKKYKFFCLRMEKNASKSLKAILRPKCQYIDSVMAGVRNVNLRSYSISNEEWNDYYKFTFVRNPYRRIVSYYFHLVKRGGFKFNDFPSKDSFYEFVKMFNPLRKRKYILQYEYLLDSHGNINFDYIGRLETINKDLKKIQRALGIRFPELPHKNRSVFIDYKLIYNDKSYDLVSKKWKKDIEFFGYDF